MKHQVTEAIMDLVFWKAINSGKTYTEAAQLLVDYLTDNPTRKAGPTHLKIPAGLPALEL